MEMVDVLTTTSEVMSVLGEVEAVYTPQVVIEGRYEPIASPGGTEEVQVR